MLHEECSFASEPRRPLFMATKAPAQTLIDSLRKSNPRNSNTELTVLEGPAPSTLKRNPEPEKACLNTFLLH